VVDLSITKSANLTTYIPGQPITYTVVVHNNGPSDAINARVHRSPARFHPRCNVDLCCDGGWERPTCRLPAPQPATLASGTGSVSGTVRINTGGTLTYTLKGTVASGTTGNIVNTATIVPAAQTSCSQHARRRPEPGPGSTTQVPTVDPACPPSAWSGMLGNGNHPVARNGPSPRPQP
jgi:hypothetical protein